MKVIPTFEILGVNTAVLKGFNHNAYLLCPEFVQFLVKSLNLSQHKVHLAE